MSLSDDNPKRYIRIGALRELLSNSLWFIPMLLVLTYGLAAELLVTHDRSMTEWVPYAFSGGPSSAQDLLSTIAAAILTMSTLVLSVTIVALQLASQQFSPRVMRAFFRDSGTKVAIGMLLGTFVYSLVVLRAVVPETATLDPFVPGAAVSVGFLLTLVALGMFIYYINHVAHSIRVVYIVDAVASETRGAIGRMMIGGSVPDPAAIPSRPPDHVVPNARNAGLVTDVDTAGLVGLARLHHCCIGVVPHVGDFVPHGAPIARVWHDPGHDDCPTASQICERLALSKERTMSQDVAFGFRQLVDIAERALSPAVNDPTTAVQAIDQIHDLLRRLVGASFPTGYYGDADGALRAFRPMHTWDDYVEVAFTEIRRYGHDSLQVHRRLRAAIADLLEVAGDDDTFTEPLIEQRRRLDRSARDGLPDSADRRLAMQGDEQGLGAD
ncbi:MAG: DUF2254 domain-containing protein [Microthrixaceae bacterium]